MASSALTFLQAHPIILVITAIVELVAVLVIAYQKCEAFRNAVNLLSTGILTYRKEVKETQVAVEGLTWAQIQWLQSFEDLKKMAPSTANAINGFADACYQARHATDNLDDSMKTATAEYSNAKKAIEDQISSLEVLTVATIGREKEGRKESDTNLWIEQTIKSLRAEMDGLDQSYAKVTDEIQKKIKAQEEEKKTQELLMSLTDTYNLSVAKASLTMNTYGEAFTEAFGAGRINEALDVAKNFAAQFSISINDAIRTLEGFSTATADSFSNLSDAAKEYLTGQAQDNIGKFKDCATSKLETLKKNIENLDILDAIRISSGLLPGAVTVPTIQASLASAQAVKRLNYVPAMAEGGIVTEPTLSLVGESGPEAIIPLDKTSSIDELKGLQDKLQKYLLPLERPLSTDVLKVLGEKVQKHLETGTRRMAEGGIVTSPTLTWVGERGPEAIVPLGKGNSLGNVTIEINVTGAVDKATADYAVSQMKSALTNVIIEASSISGSSTHKRIRWEE